MTMLDAMFGSGALADLVGHLWRPTGVTYEGINYITGPIDLAAGVEPIGVRPEDASGGGTDYGHMVRVTVANGAGGLSTPPFINDTVTIDSVPYSVRRIVGATATHYQLDCEKHAAHEVARKAFRGSR